MQRDTRVIIVIALLFANLVVSMTRLPWRQSDATMKLRELVITDDDGVARARLKHDTHTSLAFLGSNGDTLLELVAVEDGTTGLRVFVPRTEGEVFVGEHVETERSGVQVRSKEHVSFFSGLKKTEPMSVLAGQDGRVRAFFALKDEQPAIGLCTPAAEPRLTLAVESTGVARIDFLRPGEEDPRLVLVDGRTATSVRIRDQQGVPRVTLGVNVVKENSHAAVEVRDAEESKAVLGSSPNGLGVSVGNESHGDQLWLGRRDDGHCRVGFFFPNGKPMGGLLTGDEGASLEFLDIDGQVLFKGPRK